MNPRGWWWKSYAIVPHGPVNAAARALARLRHPPAVVDWAVRAWIALAAIDMTEYESTSYASLEDFFLRRLKPSVRRIGDGIIAPADGTIVGLGEISRGQLLQIKGQGYSLERLLNGKGKYDLDVRPFEGGRYLTTFLHPSGYHFVHAPMNATVAERRWIPGRYYPQNLRALAHITRIYERNERLVLTLSGAAGMSAVMVMVGASLIGGIQLRGVESVRTPRPVAMGKVVAKGDELGHFTFGSTVVLLLPRDAGFSVCPEVALGKRVRMGDSLLLADTM